MAGPVCVERCFAAILCTCRASFLARPGPPQLCPPSRRPAPVHSTIRFRVTLILIPTVNCTKGKGGCVPALNPFLLPNSNTSHCVKIRVLPLNFFIFCEAGPRDGGTGCPTTPPGTGGRVVRPPPPGWGDGLSDHPPPRMGSGRAGKKHCPNKLGVLKYDITRSDWLGS